MIDATNLERVTSNKHLSIWLEDTLTFGVHTHCQPKKNPQTIVRFLFSFRIIFPSTPIKRLAQSTYLSVLDDVI